MVKITKRRIVFFDLDGTLHKQNMFKCFICYLLLHNLLNLLLVIPLLPIVIFGLIINGNTSRWPMSLFLWSITFGRSKDSLFKDEKKFVKWFRMRLKIFPIVYNTLINYIKAKDVDVWLITGSPQSLVEKVYYDFFFLSKIKLISSQTQRKWGGVILTVRCLGHEKVKQLEKKIGIPLHLYSGYSDSNKDNPLLFFCDHRWRVTANGYLQRLK
ncbi:MAG: acid phosphatase AphA [Pantoea sp. Brub]|nr:acid phosphatase AphA [Pantoea sp. Brub]